MNVMVMKGDFLLSGLIFFLRFGSFDIQAVISVTHCTEPEITVVSFTSRPFSVGKDLNLLRSMLIIMHNVFVQNKFGSYLNDGLFILMFNL